MRRPASYMTGVVVRASIFLVGFILAVMFIYMGLWPVGVAVAAVAVALYAGWYVRQAKLARAMKKAHLEH